MINSLFEALIQRPALPDVHPQQSKTPSSNEEKSNIVRGNELDRPAIAQEEAPSTEREQGENSLCLPLANCASTNITWNGAGSK